MTKVHFLGIGGSGASAAANIAQAQGFEVTGCDLEPNNEFTTQFKPNQLLKGHSGLHLSGVNVIAVTPAIYSLDPNNPELLEAKKLGIEVLTWQEFMGKYLMKGKFVIAVCGTHGKTTTTAMIAKLMVDADLDPTVELGAIVPEWGTNYRVSKRHPELDSGSIQNRFRIKSGMTKKEYFIVEADEYNDNFLSIKPDISIVTNIDMDHPEYFKDFESYKESFKKFLLQTKGAIVANLKDSAVAEVMKDLMKQTKVTCFDYSNNRYNLKLKVPGDFNQSNATGAFQVGLLLNIDPQNIKQSLQNYSGVGRRFEYIGEYKGAKVYSDFGHHPTEIRETLKALREKFPTQRILVIYQPHMFTRTKYLFNDFVKVFQAAPADKIFIMDIYQSREADSKEVSSKQLVKAINKPSVSHLGGVITALKRLKPEIKSGDILFFMSAGDTDYLAKKLVG